MEKNEQETQDDDLRPEYDFSQLRRIGTGIYAERYRAGTNLVRLDPDVAAVFKSEAAVNQALRSLIELARAHAGTAE
jgi:hypothetical protein